MNDKNTYKIAVIPGDGIGPEIVPAGVKVLNAAAEYFDFELQYEEFPYGAGYYKETGAFMPDDALDVLKVFDALYSGAIWSGAIMLEHLGREQAAECIVRAIEATIQQGIISVDLGGSAKTLDIANAVVSNLRSE